MKITVKESAMVKPMKETPTKTLWLSNLDLIYPFDYHSRLVNFYSSNGAADFFDAAMMKAALSKALVEFYPIAGRLERGEDGEIVINCNGEGVQFVEAECDGAMDELCSFSPSPDISLVPTVDYSKDISTIPLFLLQLTRFKCGGVSFSFSNDHHLSDGIACHYFVNMWSEIIRGLITGHTVRPLLDRRVLSARNPPQPTFPHIEHQPPPSLKTPLNVSGDTTFSTFRLSPHQINALKQQCVDKKVKYSTFQVLTGHVWRCASIARGLAEDQETRLRFSVDGRQKLRPPLPKSYLGNGIFYTAASALCGQLESNPLKFAVGRVREAIDRIDNDYMRSALDYMELHQRIGKGVLLNKGNLSCPNLGITNWTALPINKTDFGWGKPVYTGPGAAVIEGRSYLFADLRNEGCVMLAISLYSEHMERFEKLFYDVVIEKKIRHRL
ncbi:rosmarinate synthase-like [Salvia hispanica]|uniref:rosmarinate synthase-like n=1 Tax=Salvia hispanica TaxID=49212 RepID=UPI0020098EBB|nr:rosmarinate synthase-like [Salvia hispanica]